jgi:beta-glucanase (GH16 family)
MAWALLAVVAGAGVVNCAPAEIASEPQQEQIGQSQQAVTNSPYVPAGYMCKVNDEFGGDFGGNQANAYIDSTKWSFQNIYTNNELENYTTRQCADGAHAGDWNYCVHNGTLTIQARNNSLDCTGTTNAQCADYYVNGSKVSGANKSYTSGRLSSKNKVALQNGYIEFKARLPFQGVSAQSGLWPAIWFLGNSINEGLPPGSTAWPWAPELDLMEWQSPLNKFASNAIFIGGDGNMDACNAWPEGGSPECHPSTWTVSQPYSGFQGWHTYGLLWTSSQITAYVDGVSQGYVTTTGNANEYNAPMFALINMAVGGDLGGAVQVSDWTKATLDVDYMRWYQSGGSDTCGGACTAESNTAFCSRLGKNCGSVTANDNCGTSRTVSSCGTCTSPATCGGGGTANVCGGGACTAESNTAFCQRLGKSCGSVTANDNCGTSRTVSSCGTCNSPTSCTSNFCDGGTSVTIQAESKNGSGGGNNILLETCGDTGGGQSFMDVGDGEYAYYNNVNFANVTTFQARVAANTDGFPTSIEFRRDSQTGTLMGTCYAPLTGAWQTYTTVSCNATGATGTGTLYTVFHGAHANSMLSNVNWFKLFTSGACTAETNTAFCSRLGKNCGSVTANDNCGTSRTVSSCGTCTSPATCGGGGTANVCGGGACTAETNTAFCSRLGKNCGSVTANDNCGTSRTVSSCGTCTSPATCGGGGTANVCGGGGGTACKPAYAQANCGGYTSYTPATQVSNGGHNWTCLNDNCRNCATTASCAPGGTGCPWGTVWTDNGACQ